MQFLEYKALLISLNFKVKNEHSVHIVRPRIILGLVTCG